MKLAFFIGRILFALIFLSSAPGLFSRDAIQLATDHHVAAAGILVPLAGLLAMLGGLSVLLGFKGKAGACLLVVFLIPVTLAMHNFWAISDPAAARMQQIEFMKNLAILGGALILTCVGTGAYSLDTWLAASSSERKQTTAAAPTPASSLGLDPGQ